MLAAAERTGVRQELFAQWNDEQAGKADRETRRAREVTAKAWRFAGEMDEIAATFREAGLPGEFHDAAALIYRRLAGFKDAPATPELDDVLAALADSVRT